MICYFLRTIGCSIFPARLYAKDRAAKATVEERLRTPQMDSMFSKMSRRPSSLLSPPASNDMFSEISNSHSLLQKTLVLFLNTRPIFSKKSFQQRRIKSIFYSIRIMKLEDTQGRVSIRTWTIAIDAKKKTQTVFQCVKEILLERVLDEKQKKNFCIIC
jgi:hypothetical protein